MKDTKKFEEAIYYFKKHKVDINKICSRRTILESFQKVYKEKKILAFGTLIILAAVLLMSIFVTDYIKHGGICAIFCIIALSVAFVWFLIATIKEMKSFNQGIHFSRGTGKHVFELSSYITRECYDDFMIFLQNYLTNKK